MRVKIFADNEGYINNSKNIVRLFYPHAEFISAPAVLTDGSVAEEVQNTSDPDDIKWPVLNSEGTEYDLGLLIRYGWDDNGLLYADGAAICDGKPIVKKNSQSKAVSAGDSANQAKRLANLVLFQILCKMQTDASFLPRELKPIRQSVLPWGILTGVRPTKIVHRLLDEGWDKKQIIDYLQQEYAVLSAKAEMLTEIAVLQRAFLPRSGQKSKVSIYIGIPFCPTRCAYCSFAAYPLAQWQNYVEDYLAALDLELDTVFAFLRQQHISVENVYLGGGTPTSLDCEQMQHLLRRISENISVDELYEYTVEAGRPDTVTASKLKIMRRHGVNRISINPQTMNDRTLRLIGREHSAEDVLRAFALAREEGFEWINMDMILGLPEETTADVKHTLDCLLSLKPENLTVHTLAVKRASRLNQQAMDFNLPEDNEAAAQAEISEQMIRSAGYLPYYLYRQKQMLGSLENVGYSLSGKEALYNIQMMEERQVVIGLGAGAGSKYIDQNDGSLINQYNPKDPLEYSKRAAILAEIKVRELQKLTDDLI